jgi:hypothetical protein
MLQLVRKSALEPSRYYQRTPEAARRPIGRTVHEA